MTLSTNEFVMRRKMKHVLTVTLVLSALIASFTGCEDDPKRFGEQIMHPDDSITANYDTSYVLDTRVVPSDSFSTLYHFFDTRDFIRNYPSMLVGKVNNEFFGTMEASFITQVSKSDSINFEGDTLEAVGADLYFKIDDYYGPQNTGEFQVYKINKDLAIDEPYYNNTNAENFYSDQDLISSSTTYMGDSLIKVSLTKSFAEELTTADDTTMADPNDFLKFFQGIYVKMTPPNQDGFINKLNMTNDTTHMELVYRREGTTEEPDTLEYPINQGSIRFNIFRHDYQAATNPEVNVSNFLNNDESKNDSILMISGLGGTRAKITIPPEIRTKFQQDSVFLARASIEVKTMPEYNDFLQPDQLSMYSYFNDTSYVNVSNTNFFDGELDEDNNMYTCNITSYMQAFINEETDGTVYLHNNSYKTEPARLIFSGTGISRPIKLKIKYFKP